MAFWLEGRWYACMHITRERAIFSVRWYHSGDGLMTISLKKIGAFSIYGNFKEDMPPTCPFAESGPADMPAPRGVGFNYDGLGRL